MHCEVEVHSNPRLTTPTHLQREGEAYGVEVVAGQEVHEGTNRPRLKPLRHQDIRLHACATTSDGWVQGAQQAQFQVVLWRGNISSWKAAALRIKCRRHSRVLMRHLPYQLIPLMNTLFPFSIISPFCDVHISGSPFLRQ